MEKDMTYGAYLKLEQLLSAQAPVSRGQAKPAHDELFFIIVHQVYELWFKEMLHEIDSVRELFDTDFVDEQSIGVAVHRLKRVVEIQKLLIQQIEVIETMTPLDFLEFRGYLPGASGFQSVQFRMLENKLGLLSTDRLQYNNRPYHAEYTKADIDAVTRAEKEPTLFSLLEKWLERTPFLEHESFSFLRVFEEAFTRMVSEELAIISSAQSISPEERELRSKMSEQSINYVRSVLDEMKFVRLRNDGKVRLSYRAFCAALFINLYRDQPILQMPFTLLGTVLDLDEHLNLWRYRHSLMVLRMIGAKLGTGGSSGHDYLRATVQKHAIFTDLYMISTFYIPRSKLPPLDPAVTRSLGFQFSSGAAA